VKQCRSGISSGVKGALGHTAPNWFQDPRHWGAPPQEAELDLPDVVATERPSQKAKQAAGLRDISAEDPKEGGEDEDMQMDGDRGEGRAAPRGRGEASSSSSSSSSSSKAASRASLPMTAQQKSGWKSDVMTCAAGGGGEGGGGRGVPGAKGGAQTRARGVVAGVATARHSAMLRKQQDPGPQGQGNKMKKSLLREKARADAAVAARDRLALTNKRLKAGVCLHCLWSFSSSLLVRSHAR